MSTLVRALLIAALALPAFAEAPREYRVGMLMPAPFSAGGYFKAFEDELARLGFVEGRNLRIIRRAVDASIDSAATALVAERPDVLVTEGTLLTQALQRATPTLPLVFAGTADPVRSGLVATLAHPGGHTTGVVNLECELTRKRLEVMREILRPARRLVVLRPRTDPPLCPIDAKDLDALQATLHEDATTNLEDFRAFMQQLVRTRPDGIVGSAISGEPTDPDVQIARELLGKIPLAADGDGWTREAALVALKVDGAEVQRRAASQVARILGGARAGDLPVETATRFHLTVNLKRAAELGIRVPQTVLLRADRVVE